MAKTFIINIQIPTQNGIGYLTALDVRLAILDLMMSGKQAGEITRQNIINTVVGFTDQNSGIYGTADYAREIGVDVDLTQGNEGGVLEGTVDGMPDDIFARVEAVLEHLFTQFIPTKK